MRPDPTNLRSNSHLGSRYPFGVHALACFRDDGTLKGGHQTLRGRQEENCCQPSPTYLTDELEGA
jgi:hypothetical protein